MKHVVQQSLMILLLFATVTGAQGAENFMVSPYHAGMAFDTESAPQTDDAEATFEAYIKSLKYFKLFEYFSSIRYHSEKINCTFRVEYNYKNPGIVTRIQLFKKPIFLTFSISE